MNDLIELSAREAAARIAAGTLSAEKLMRACLERIAFREKEIGAFAHLDPDQALAAARACDREGRRGPLHGIPLGVKDIMDTVDLPTEYGSAAYAGHRPPRDAAPVALAKEAGAVVIGKTVTTEFAAMNPGKTRNPHKLDHTPGGSSSGSAAGVADFMMPLAFGTQTAGSIIRPASYCGVVGYKPSFGLVAIAGTKTLAPSLDTVGGFARNVADIAFLIAALTGRPSLIPEAPAPATAPWRIGILEPPHFAKAEPASRHTLEHAATMFASAGAAVAERRHAPLLDGLIEAQITIMNYEAARNLAFERSARADRLAPKTRALLEEGAALSADAYDQAIREADAARAGLPALFGDFDALLVPAAPGEAPGLDNTGDPVFNRAWTLLGVPCLTLPAGLGPSGLPVGIQLVARRHDDARLLRLGAFAEAALGR
ncbi:MAG TPA: amidase [Stellaceae bacterium]|nr:amidase [Stellaceae bacterium]